MRQRQAEGIRMAKLRGVKFGRPTIKKSSNFDEISEEYFRKEITNTEACRILNMSKGTFFRYLSVFKEKKNPL